MSAALVACRAPDRRAGVFVEHPEHWGGDLIAIHHGTFSDTRPNIRIRTAPLSAAGFAVANLEYPTSGKRNRDIEALVDGHARVVADYLDSHPEAAVTFVGFSQGGCVELDLVARLARAAPERLSRASLVLLAPARDVKFGGATALAKRMIARCEAAETALDAMARAAPEGPVATLLGERSYLAWSCDDAIVGHDSFTTLVGHLDPAHVYYLERGGHIAWASKARRSDDADAPYGERIELASALTRAVAEARDPREVLSAYVELASSCDADR